MERKPDHTAGGERQIGQLLRDWRLHLLVLAIVVAAESVGKISFKVGVGSIVLLPLLYALVIGAALFFTPLVDRERSQNAEPVIVLGLGVLIAKIGIVIGPNIGKLAQMGPALLLQELGNFGTILLALPVAVWLGMKREAVGMVHSIGREPNVGLIASKYGFNSPEGRGVMAMYVFGTVFGAVFLGLLAAVLAAYTPLSPQALAMASGVGSGSMMAASSGSLIAAFPESEEQIIALAGASNLISTATGLYASLFVGLPLTEKLYGLLTRRH
ncbi:DUF3100 domain-containing protein [Neisseria leonii]|uniref:DUF3100 domain-containing protein n=2 Tax=Neisseria leonii TaxID=2995413 RepID=A0A9X4E233_9NEIS|nr:DUF3100 domain-containing protein [Neisseria sp. 51.81]MDD9328191.1 DUF3100 domain-containing protein [Neisseria sp. 51.81]